MKKSKFDFFFKYRVLLIYYEKVKGEKCLEVGPRILSGIPRMRPILKPTKKAILNKLDNVMTKIPANEIIKKLASVRTNKSFAVITEKTNNVKTKKPVNLTTKKFADVTKIKSGNVIKKKPINVTTKKLPINKTTKQTNVITRKQANVNTKQSVLKKTKNHTKVITKTPSSATTQTKKKTNHAIIRPVTKEQSNLTTKPTNKKRINTSTISSNKIPANVIALKRRVKTTKKTESIVSTKTTKLTNKAIIIESTVNFSNTLPTKKLNTITPSIESFDTISIKIPAQSDAIISSSFQQTSPVNVEKPSTLPFNNTIIAEKKTTNRYLLRELNLLDTTNEGESTGYTKNVLETILLPDESIVSFLSPDTGTANVSALFSPSEEIATIFVEHSPTIDVEKLSTLSLNKDTFSEEEITTQSTSEITVISVSSNVYQLDTTNLDKSLVKTEFVFGTSLPPKEGIVPSLLPDTETHTTTEPIKSFSPSEEVITTVVEQPPFQPSTLPLNIAIISERGITTQPTSKNTVKSIPSEIDQSSMTILDKPTIQTENILEITLPSNENIVPSMIPETETHITTEVLTLFLPSEKVTTTFVKQSPHKIAIEEPSTLPLNITIFFETKTAIKSTNKSNVKSVSSEVNEPDTKNLDESTVRTDFFFETISPSYQVMPSLIFDTETHSTTESSESATPSDEVTSFVEQIPPLIHEVKQSILPFSNAIIFDEELTTQPTSKTTVKSVSSEIDQSNTTHVDNSTVQMKIVFETNLFHDQSLAPSFFPVSGNHTTRESSPLFTSSDEVTTPVIGQSFTTIFVKNPSILLLNNTVFASKEKTFHSSTLQSVLSEFDQPDATQLDVQKENVLEITLPPHENRMPSLSPDTETHTTSASSGLFTSREEVIITVVKPSTIMDVEKLSTLPFNNTIFTEEETTPQSASDSTVESVSNEVNEPDTTNIFQLTSDSTVKFVSSEVSEPNITNIDKSTIQTGNVLDTISIPNQGIVLSWIPDTETHTTTESSESLTPSEEVTTSVIEQSPSTIDIEIPSTYTLIEAIFSEEETTIQSTGESTVKSDSNKVNEPETTVDNVFDTISTPKQGDLTSWISVTKSHNITESSESLNSSKEVTTTVVERFTIMDVERLSTLPFNNTTFTEEEKALQSTNDSVVKYVSSEVNEPDTTSLDESILQTGNVLDTISTPNQGVAPSLIPDTKTHTTTEPLKSFTSTEEATISVVEHFFPTIDIAKSSTLSSNNAIFSDEETVTKSFSKNNAESVSSGIEQPNMTNLYKSTVQTKATLMFNKSFVPSLIPDIEPLTTTEITLLSSSNETVTFTFVEQYLHTIDKEKPATLALNSPIFTKEQILIQPKSRSTVKSLSRKVSQSSTTNPKKSSVQTKNVLDTISSSKQGDLPSLISYAETHTTTKRSNSLTPSEEITINVIEPSPHTMERPSTLPLYTKIFSEKEKTFQSISESTVKSVSSKVTEPVMTNLDESLVQTVNILKTTLFSNKSVVPSLIPEMETHIIAEICALPNETVTTNFVEQSPRMIDIERPSTSLFNDAIFSEEETTIQSTGEYTVKSDSSKANEPETTHLDESTIQIDNNLVTISSLKQDDLPSLISDTETHATTESLTPSEEVTTNVVEQFTIMDVERLTTLPFNNTTFTEEETTLQSTSDSIVKSVSSKVNELDTINFDESTDQTGNVLGTISTPNQGVEPSLIPYTKTHTTTESLESLTPSGEFTTTFLEQSPHMIATERLSTLPFINATFSEEETTIQSTIDSTVKSVSSEVDELDTTNKEDSTDENENILETTMLSNEGFKSSLIPSIETHTTTEISALSSPSGTVTTNFAEQYSHMIHIEIPSTLPLSNAIFSEEETTVQSTIESTVKSVSSEVNEAVTTYLDESSVKTENIFYTISPSYQVVMASSVPDTETLIPTESSELFTLSEEVTTIAIEQSPFTIDVERPSTLSFNITIFSEKEIAIQSISESTVKSVSSKVTEPGTIYMNESTTQTENILETTLTANEGTVPSLIPETETYDTTEPWALSIPSERVTESFFEQSPSMIDKERPSTLPITTATYSEEETTIRSTMESTVKLVSSEVNEVVTTILDESTVRTENDLNTISPSYQDVVASSVPDTDPHITTESSKLFTLSEEVTKIAIEQSPFTIDVERPSTLSFNITIFPEKEIAIQSISESTVKSVSSKVTEPGTIYMNESTTQTENILETTLTANEGTVPSLIPETETYDTTEPWALSIPSERVTESFFEQSPSMIDKERPSTLPITTATYSEEEKTIRSTMESTVKLVSSEINEVVTTILDESTVRTENDLNTISPSYQDVVASSVPDTDPHITTESSKLFTLSEEVTTIAIEQSPFTIDVERPSTLSFNITIFPEKEIAIQSISESTVKSISSNVTEPDTIYLDESTTQTENIIQVTLTSKEGTVPSLIPETEINDTTEPWALSIPSERVTESFFEQSPSMIDKERPSTLPITTATYSEEETTIRSTMESTVKSVSSEVNEVVTTVLDESTVRTENDLNIISPSYQDVVASSVPDTDPHITTESSKLFTFSEEVTTIAIEQSPFTIDVERPSTLSFNITIFSEKEIAIQSISESTVKSVSSKVTEPGTIYMNESTTQTENILETTLTANEGTVPSLIPETETYDTTEPWALSIPSERVTESFFEQSPSMIDKERPSTSPITTATYSEEETTIRSTMESTVKLVSSEVNEVVTTILDESTVRTENDLNTISPSYQDVVAFSVPDTDPHITTESSKLFTLSEEVTTIAIEQSPFTIDVERPSTLSFNITIFPEKEIAIQSISESTVKSISSNVTEPDTIYLDESTTQTENIIQVTLTSNEGAVPSLFLETETYNTTEALALSISNGKITTTFVEQPPHMIDTERLSTLPFINATFSVEETTIQSTMERTVKSVSSEVDELDTTNKEDSTDENEYILETTMLSNEGFKSSLIPSIETHTTTEISALSSPSGTVTTNFAEQYSHMIHIEIPSTLPLSNAIFSEEETTVQSTIESTVKSVSSEVNEAVTIYLDESSVQTENIFNTISPSYQVVMASSVPDTETLIPTESSELFTLSEEVTTIAIEQSPFTIDVERPSTLSFNITIFPEKEIAIQSISESTVKSISSNVTEPDTIYLDESTTQTENIIQVTLTSKEGTVPSLIPETEINDTTEPWALSIPSERVTESFFEQSPSMIDKERPSTLPITTATYSEEETTIRSTMESTVKSVSSEVNEVVTTILDESTVRTENDLNTISPSYQDVVASSVSDTESHITTESSQLFTLSEEVTIIAIGQSPFTVDVERPSTLSLSITFFSEKEIAIQSISESTVKSVSSKVTEPDTIYLDESTTQTENILQVTLTSNEGAVPSLIPVTEINDTTEAWALSIPSERVTESFFEQSPSMIDKERPSTLPITTATYSEEETTIRSTMESTVKSVLSEVNEVVTTILVESTVRTENDFNTISPSYQDVVASSVPNTDPHITTDSSELFTLSEEVTTIAIGQSPFTIEVERPSTLSFNITIFSEKEIAIQSISKSTVKSISSNVTEPDTIYHNEPTTQTENILETTLTSNEGIVSSLIPETETHTTTEVLVLSLPSEKVTTSFFEQTPRMMDKEKPSTLPFTNATFFEEETTIQSIMESTVKSVSSDVKEAVTTYLDESTVQTENVLSTISLFYQVVMASSVPNTESHITESSELFTLSEEFTTTVIEQPPFTNAVERPSTLSLNIAIFSDTETAIQSISESTEKSASNKVTEPDTIYKDESMTQTENILQATLTVNEGAVPSLIPETETHTTTEVLPLSLPSVKVTKTFVGQSPHMIDTERPSTLPLYITIFSEKETTIPSLSESTIKSVSSKNTKNLDEITALTENSLETTLASNESVVPSSIVKTETYTTKEVSASSLSNEKASNAIFAEEETIIQSTRESSEKFVSNKVTDPDTTNLDATTIQTKNILIKTSPPNESFLPSMTLNTEDFKTNSVEQLTPIDVQRPSIMPFNDTISAVEVTNLANLTKPYFTLYTEIEGATKALEIFTINKDITITTFKPFSTIKEVNPSILSTNHTKNAEEVNTSTSNNRSSSTHKITNSDTITLQTSYLTVTNAITTKPNETSEHPTNKSSNSTTKPTTRQPSDSTTKSTTKKIVNLTTIPTTKKPSYSTMKPTTQNTSNSTTKSITKQPSTSTIKPTTKKSTTSTTNPTIKKPSNSTTKPTTKKSSSSITKTTTKKPTTSTTKPMAKKPSNSTTKSTTKIPSYMTTKPTTKKSTSLTTKATTKKPSNSTTKSTTKKPSNSTMKPTTKKSSSSTTRTTTKKPTTSTTKPITKKPNNSTTKSTTMKPSNSTTKPTTKKSSNSTTTTKKSSSSTTKTTTKKPSNSTTKPMTKNPSSSTTKSTTKKLSNSTSKPTTKKPSNSTTKPTTKKSSSSTTKTSIKKPSNSTTKSTTKKPSNSTTKSTTKKSSSSTTKLTTKKPSNSTTKSTTKKPSNSTTKSTTKKSSGSTTKTTTKKQTTSTTKLMTKKPNNSTTMSTIKKPSNSTTKPTTKKSSSSTTKPTTKKPSNSTTKSTTKKPSNSTTKSTIKKRSNSTTTTEKSSGSITKTTTKKPTTSTTKPMTKKPSNSTTKSTTKKPSNSTTKSTTKKPSNSTTKPTTKKSSSSTIKPTTKNPSNSTTKSTTKKPSNSTTKPTTKKSSSSTTKPTTKKPSYSTTKPTTKKPSSSTTKPTTKKPSYSTTKPTTKELTSSTTKPTTKKPSNSTTKSTTKKPSNSTMKPTTKKSSSSTTKTITKKPTTSTTKPITKKPNNSTTKSTTMKPSNSTTKPTTKKRSSSTTKPTTKKPSNSTTKSATKKRSNSTTTTKKSSGSITKTTTKKPTTSTSKPMTKKPSNSTTKSTTKKPSNSTTKPTTKKSSSSTIKPTTKNPSNSTTKSTTKEPSNSTKKPTTKKSSSSTTKPTTKKTSYSTTKPTTKESTSSTTKPTTKKPSNSTTKSTTKKPSNSTTKPTTMKPSNSTTKPTTKKPSSSTTKPTTKKPSNSTTKSTTKKPNNSTTKPTTKKPSSSTTKPTTKKPSHSTTKPTTKELTSSTTKPTTKKPSNSTTKSTTNKPSISTTKPTTKKSSSSTTKTTTKKPTTSTTKPITKKPNSSTPKFTTKKPSNSTTKPTTKKPSNSTTNPTTKKPTTSTIKLMTKKQSNSTTKPMTEKLSNSTTKTMTKKLNSSTTKTTTKKPTTSTTKPTTKKSSNSITMPTTKKASNSKITLMAKKTSNSTTNPTTTIPNNSLSIHITEKQSNSTTKPSIKKPSNLTTQPMKTTQNDSRITASTNIGTYDTTEVSALFSLNEKVTTIVEKYSTIDVERLSTSPVAIFTDEETATLSTSDFVSSDVDQPDTTNLDEPAVHKEYLKFENNFSITVKKNEQDTINLDEVTKNSENTLPLISTSGKIIHNHISSELDGTTHLDEPSIQTESVLEIKLPSNASTSLVLDTSTFDITGVTKINTPDIIISAPFNEYPPILPTCPVLASACPTLTTSILTTLMTSSSFVDYTSKTESLATSTLEISTDNRIIKSANTAVKCTHSSQSPFIIPTTSMTAIPSTTTTSTLTTTSTSSFTTILTESNLTNSAPNCTQIRKNPFVILTTSTIAIPTTTTTTFITTSTSTRTPTSTDKSTSTKKISTKKCTQVPKRRVKPITHDGL